ncbi:MAG: SDR family NAD(P)-dependent oxidoreductase [Planctomycetes bacterium]|nr:SDR family NAD(P)-dependent oxidoreductase [Planctomycetota bacterium]
MSVSIDLTEKTALITGGSQGLGLVTASTLHRAGAIVCLNYFPDDAGLNRSNAESAVANLGDRAFAIGADVRNVNDVERLLKEVIERTGHLDIIINNAAIIRDRTIRKMSDFEWQDVIDTNLTGVFHVCRAAADWMSKGGRIVNMASLSGAVGLFGQANYSSAKAGVMAMTKVVSREFAKRKITVNAIAPGVVLTEMGKSIPQDTLAEMLKQIPLERSGHVNGGWYASS